MSDDEAQNPDWPQTRWARLVDRVELRQAGLGLKFWGPPLWLEVTMSGPDSDRWPANAEGTESWNWQSPETCVEAEDLLDQAADDDQLVIAVARYTVENLILNAVHEIGEWLRFDGRRVFPAHLAPQASSGAADGQGNGSVHLTVAFSPPVQPTPAVPVAQPDPLRAQRQLRRLTELAEPSRFTYLPGTAFDYDAAGPIIRLYCEDRPATGWRWGWSSATLDAVQSDADAETVIGFVGRDIHGALVAWEADRICRAFHIDRRRRWRLLVPGATLGPDPAEDDGDVDEILTFTIAYLDPNGSTHAVPPADGKRPPHP